MTIVKFTLSPQQNDTCDDHFGQVYLWQTNRSSLLWIGLTYLAVTAAEL